MAKKHSRQPARRDAKQSPPTPLAALQRARESLAAQRFRDAIGQFKDLLKTEARAPAQEGLAAAYQGRARELTEKGMLKEALVIWDNRAQFCPGAPMAPEYVALLLRAGSPREALNALHRGAGALAAEDQARLRGLFAAHYLAEPSILAGLLPADDPILLHGVPARAALEAYCRGDDGAVEEALRQVPFRSPYRDWVQVLRALLRLRDDPTGAAGLLQRVSADSPFVPVLRAAQLALLSEQGFLDASGSATEAERRVAASLRGWAEGRLALWEEVRRLGDPPSPLDLLSLLQRRRQVLGEGWARRHGLRLLTQGYPQSLQWVRRAGARPLSRLEDALVAAWSAEESGDPEAAYEDWSEVIQAIRGLSELRPGSDEALSVALIQRRLATHWKLLEGPRRTKVEAYLEESLRLDPEDRDTYVLLGAHYRRGAQLPAARRVLEAALERWPEEVSLLAEALETAVAGDAFKKATGFARRILAIDPINRSARQSLFAAHLSHARKQLKRRRPDLARRELEQAAAWASGAHDEARRDLVWGIGLADDAPGAGAARLRSAIERLGGGMTGQLELALEAAYLGLIPAAVLERAGQRVSGRPEKADLLLFCRRLREKLEAGGAVPSMALHPFSAALRAGSKLDLSRQETEAVCETLRLLPSDTMRPLYAREALKRWPGEPVFEFHAVEAKAARRPLSGADDVRLEWAAERARRAGDTRTAHRLEELLRGPALLPPFLDPDLVPFGEPSGEPSGGLSDAELDLLFETLPDGPVKREMRDAERRLGRKKLREILLQMLEDLGPAPRDLPPPRPPLSPPARQPQPDHGKPGRGGPPAAPDSSPPEPASSPAPDSPDAQQLDLFK